MENKIQEVKIKATGQTVKVFKLKTGGWGNYQDGGKTTYTDKEIIFIA